MPLQPLTLQSLNYLDGGQASSLIAAHLKRAAQDAYDRPGDKTVRKVVMEILVVPVLRPDGGVDRCELQVQVKSQVPSHKSSVYSVAVRPTGALLFNEDSPDNVDQSTMFPREANPEE